LPSHHRHEDRHLTVTASGITSTVPLSGTGAPGRS
jgi:hypothetical protein